MFYQCLQCIIYVLCALTFNASIGFLYLIHILQDGWIQDLYGGGGGGLLNHQTL